MKLSGSEVHWSREIVTHLHPGVKHVVSDVLKVAGGLAGPANNIFLVCESL